MKRFVLRSGLLAFGCLLAVAACANESREAIRSAIVGDAILQEGAYRMLETLSDRFGARMVGTEGHRKSLEYLEASLQELGLETRRQRFEFPGWRRGEARVELMAPTRRTLRAAELGYVESSGVVEGRVAYIDQRDTSELLRNDLRDRVLLLKPNLAFTRDELSKFKEAGVVGVLLINRVNGGQLLARVANHVGEAPPFPMLSITQEEGFWMQRLVEEGEAVKVTLSVGASIETMTGTNLIATLPGDSAEKVVLGGHFDSWDLGQGAIDNGLGVVQLYETARLLAKGGRRNAHTVELVWFDAEEFGLWGSRHYAEEMDPDGIRVMVNLDMVGRPIALNAMGFDELAPRLKSFSDDLGSWSFSKKVANKTWLGSDHHPFIVKGVPAVTFNAPLDHEDARYYHDFADTFDKVDREMLGRASAIVALLIDRLANEALPKPRRLRESEVIQLFRKAGVESKLKRNGQWPFSETPQKASDANPKNID